MNLSFGWFYSGFICIPKNTNHLAVGEVACHSVKRQGYRLLYGVKTHGLPKWSQPKSRFTPPFPLGCKQQSVFTLQQVLLGSQWEGGRYNITHRPARESPHISSHLGWRASLAHLASSPWPKPQAWHRCGWPGLSMFFNLHSSKLQRSQRVEHSPPSTGEGERVAEDSRSGTLPLTHSLRKHRRPPSSL